VRVAAARKAVRAWGDRQIERRADGSLGFSAPVPFTRMPLTWDLAYGGRDVHAEDLLRDTEDEPLLQLDSDDGDGRFGGILAYPRNRVGRGFFVDVDADRIVGTLAPNLEDASDPVAPERLLARDTLDWIDRPVAACYEPIDWFTFPRAMFLLPPDFHPPTRPVHELASGALLSDDLRERDLFAAPDGRAYNCAPAGLAVCRLDGTERVSLWNLHAQHELLEFDLPDDRPRFILEPPGVAPRELRPLLQTVLIEPDEERVTLTWAGMLEVAMPYPDEMTRTMRHSVAWSR
jgi:hypothetical protein